MKKTALQMVALAILALLLTVQTFAHDNDREYTNEYTAYRDIIPKYDELLGHLYDSVVDGEFYVNLRGYEIKEEHIVAVFNDLVSYSPELFFLNSKLSYGYTNRYGTDYVTGIYFYYNMQGRELREAQKIFSQEVAYIASLVDPRMSDAEKALWVHDYMVSLYVYDKELQIYDAYRIMTGEYGVCRAYSLAYSAVLEELGMKCTMVISNEMNHAWNIVQIDGKWYHVDLVYDDPGIDRPGRVSHKYFLLSDSEISEREVGAHYGWKTSIVCDESYGGRKPWENVNTQMTYNDGKWYYVDEEAKAIVREDFDETEREIFYEFTNRWYTNKNRKNKWVGVFSGTCTYDGKLIINTDRQVMAVDPDNGAGYVIYESAADEQICGVTAHKGEIKCFISFHVNGDENSRVERVKIPKLTDELFEESKPLPFTDVTGAHPYYPAISYVYAHGLFNGVSDTKFEPDSTLTRAMFVTVLGRLCGVDESEYNETLFDDVPTGEWYSPYVAWAAKEGIVNGLGNGKFDPTGELTREQMYKIAAYCATLLTDYDAVTTRLLPYSDSDSISSWAYDSVKYCEEWGLIDSHEGELNPTAKATRAEAADIIARLSKIINK